MEHVLIFGIGFLAQALFFARTIAQWFKSEHEGKVISPNIFWQISLAASICMLIYGILRNDAAIVTGQLLVYFIYIRNLQLKNAWTSMPLLLRAIAFLTPPVILFFLFTQTDYTIDTFLKNEDNPLFLMIWGITAQIVFISRFFYQWMYSENRNESLLPLGFWIISIVGSSMNIVYAVFRLDPVLFLAHLLSMVIYLRNVLILRNRKGLFGKANIPFADRIIHSVSKKIK
ncbi:MAG: lipid-A-disaccharide synthase N-terminal domain-containing protein [Prolixibacteraceae bacterium]|nr:lipid-A-disaccharide synthase N-terminal domain-containing protein [Prolixibacteraceae bacterium]